MAVVHVLQPKNVYLGADKSGEEFKENASSGTPKRKSDEESEQE
eukprot:COSAG02_NODE_31047_length_540_cov_0.934240_1_plen_43_part_10